MKAKAVGEYHNYISCVESWTYVKLWCIAESMTSEDINAATLRNNTDFFQQHIRIRGLINKLHAEDILSDDDTRFIKTLDHESEKIDEILNVIRNSSSKDYDTFVSFLRQSGQTLVADVAEKGGGQLSFHFNNNNYGPSNDIFFIDQTDSATV